MIEHRPLMAWKDIGGPKTLEYNQQRTMSTLFIVLMAATLLCALTTGLLVTFAVVVMPGIGDLPDRDFLKAFKVMDRIIQEGDGRFLAMWAGSVVALVASSISAAGSLGGPVPWLIFGATALWILAVQVPTIIVHLPLNNRLKDMNIAASDDEGVQTLRAAFESRWVPWNTFRSVAGLVTTIVLLMALAANSPV